MNRALLVCGIIASLIYVGSDIVAGMSWEGYSFASQAVSELRGIGAPTRTFLVPVLFIYTILETAFGLGIWRTAGKKRSLRITGALFIGLGIFDLMGPLFVMDASQSVGAVTNVLHIIATVLTLVSIFLIIGFGSLADGKWFFWYSVATFTIVLVFGALTFLELRQIAANLPTPWMGVKERINIYSYMLWIAMLALVLLRKQINKGE